jgi:hypothetical protein
MASSHGRPHSLRPFDNPGTHPLEARDGAPSERPFWSLHPKPKRTPPTPAPPRMRGSAREFFMRQGDAGLCLDWRSGHRTSPPSRPRLKSSHMRGNLGPVAFRRGTSDSAMT